MDIENIADKRETVSKRLRAALLVLMSDQKVRNMTDMIQDLRTQNMILNTDYNTNHLWGVIKTLTSSEELVRVSRGNYQINSSNCKTDSSLQQNPIYQDRITALSDIYPKRNTPETQTLSTLYATALKQLHGTLKDIETTLDSLKLSQLKAADIQTLYKISTLRESLTKLLKETEQA